jgi:hypothetical protein
MQFGTFLDQKGFFVDTVHFPPIAARWPFRGKGIYRIIGKVTEEFGFFSLEVHELHMLDMMPDPRYDEKTVSNDSNANETVITRNFAAPRKPANNSTKKSPL